MLKTDRHQNSSTLSRSGWRTVASTHAQNCSDRVAVLWVVAAAALLELAEPPVQTLCTGSATAAFYRGLHNQSRRKHARQAHSPASVAVLAPCAPEGINGDPWMTNQGDHGGDDGPRGHSAPGKARCPVASLLPSPFLLVSCGAPALAADAGCPPGKPDQAGAGPCPATGPPFPQRAADLRFLLRRG
jgi:hypothetical protein